MKVWRNPCTGCWIDQWVWSRGYTSAYKQSCCKINSGSRLCHEHYRLELKLIKYFYFIVTFCICIRSYIISLDFSAFNVFIKLFTIYLVHDVTIQKSDLTVPVLLLRKNFYSDVLATDYHKIIKYLVTTNFTLVCYLCFYQNSQLLLYNVEF